MGKATASELKSQSVTWRPRTLWDFVLKERERGKETWLVKGLIRPGDIVDLIDEATSGKTTFCAQLLSCIQRGKSFLGMKTASAPVGYLGNENSARSMRRKFKAHGVSTKSIRYDRALERYELPKASAVRYLTRFIMKKPRLRILVLDTLLHFIDRDNKKFRGGFSDNDTDAWYIIMPMLRKIAEKTHCAILYTAHRTSKTGPRRGSKVTEAATDVHLHMSRDHLRWNLHIKGRDISERTLTLGSSGKYTFRIMKKGEHGLPDLIDRQNRSNAAVTAVEKALTKSGGILSAQELQGIASAHGIPTRGDNYRAWWQNLGLMLKKTKSKNTYRRLSKRWKNSHLGGIRGVFHPPSSTKSVNARVERFRKFRLRLHRLRNFRK